MGRRPMKKPSNDHDFVPPTQYHPYTKDTLPNLSEFEQIPQFEPMEFESKEGVSQLPDIIDSSDPEAIFRLFFTNTVLDLLVRCTNQHAKR